MKTFRTIGLTLAAVLMCVNFTACEEDDDEPAQNNKSKKLVEIKMVSNEDDYTETMTFKFSYDENNRLVSCEHYDEENYISVRNYTWEGNTISEDCYLIGDCHSRLLYKLENGLIKSISDVDVNGATDEITELTYNSDNRIIEFNIENKAIERYTWENNKITSYVVEGEMGTPTPCPISYNDKTCNGHIPLFWLVSDLGELVYTNPELFGLKLNALPSKVEHLDEDEYFDSYTFDSDGYVKSFTVYNTIENCTVTLKWE